MKRFLLALLLLASLAIPGAAQTYERLSGWCEQGSYPTVTDGRQSTTKVQRSFVSCTVTVYDAGTTNLAAIASDYGGTPMANPFTASVTGFWSFFGLAGRYDVRLSGAGIPTPFTIPGLWISDGGGGGGGTCTPSGFDTGVMYKSSTNCPADAGFTYTVGSTRVNIGVGASRTGTLNFLNSTNSNYVRFHAGVTTSSVDYTLPTADGTSGQFLSTNGSGVLSWATGGGGGSCPPNAGLASHLAYYPSNGCTLDDTPDTIYGVGHTGLGIWNGIHARYSAPGEAGVTLEFSAGDGGSGTSVFAGSLYLSAGNGMGTASSNGGSVHINAGAGSGTAADGGSISIQTGFAGTGSSGGAGNLTIGTGASPITGLGGAVAIGGVGTVAISAGSSLSTYIDQNGRLLSLNGGSVGPGATTGHGGFVDISAGDADATVGSTGYGGWVRINAGNGGGTSGAGGNIHLLPGLSPGLGFSGHGVVQIQENSVTQSTASLDTTQLLNDRTFYFQYRNSALGNTLYFSDPPTSDFADLGTPSDGTWRYCLDCGEGTDPCTGGSSGSYAMRVNARWTCDFSGGGGGGGGGITTLNGLTAGTQVFANADDTNVTLAIGSSVNTHTFTMGWTGTLGVARGGTNIASYTTGDILYASGATTLSKLGIGTAGQCLKTNGGATAPEWGSCGGGGGSPGGSDTYVQFNDAATFGGSAAFAWNKTTSVLTLGVASTTTGTLKFADSAGSTTTSFKAGNAASSLTFVYPVLDPTAGQALVASAPSAGVVTLSWASAGSPASPTNSVQFNNAGSFGGNSGFKYTPGGFPEVLITATAHGKFPFEIKDFDDSSSARLLSVYNSSETEGMEFSYQGNTNTGDYFDVFGNNTNVFMGVMNVKSGSAGNAGLVAYTLSNSAGWFMNNANTANTNMLNIPNSSVWDTSNNNADGGLILVGRGTNAPIKFATGGDATSNLRVTIPKDGGITIAALALGSLPSSTNGTIMWCSDCLEASDPCTASSSGTFAMRINGRWKCL